MNDDPPPKKWLLFCYYTTNLSFLKFNAKPRNSRLVYLTVFIFLDLVIILFFFFNFNTTDRLFGGECAHGACGEPFPTWQRADIFPGNLILIRGLGKKKQKNIPVNKRD